MQRAIVLSLLFFSLAEGVPKPVWPEEFDVAFGLSVIPTPISAPIVNASAHFYYNYDQVQASLIVYEDTCLPLLSGMPHPTEMMTRRRAQQSMDAIYILSHKVYISPSRVLELIVAHGFLGLELFHQISWLALRILVWHNSQLTILGYHIPRTFGLQGHFNIGQMQLRVKIFNLLMVGSHCGILQHLMLFRKMNPCLIFPTILISVTRIAHSPALLTDSRCSGYTTKCEPNCDAINSFMFWNTSHSSWSKNSLPSSHQRLLWVHLGQFKFLIQIAEKTSKPFFIPSNIFRPTSPTKRNWIQSGIESGNVLHWSSEFQVGN